MHITNPILKIKDLQNILECSRSTAQRMYKDIKGEYNIEIVTQMHLHKYLKL